MGPWGRFVDSISSRLAFFPPEPATYALRNHQDGARELYVHPLNTTDRRKVLGCEVVQLPTKKCKAGGGGETIVAAYVPYKRDTVPVILFSHGNAVDLGQMLPFYKELALQLQCNVLGYDYSGYGCSTGTPSVANTIADINACFDWLLTAKGKKAMDIVLYGQSVGSGPTIELAARTPDLGGVILHSPLMSGMRVLNPTWKRWPAWADIYPNLRLMPQVEATVLVMHGTEDEVVDFSHGQALHACAKHAAAPLWATSYNHQNLELCPQYLPHLKRFLQDLFGKDHIR
ncbi:hypothetical protein WJX72_010875 [[Myrmecia] bisecta]|uniref:Serine aminopeptidase S33 domain-containing protein n=1 Tax=[Myrmecia] bisecta TaxID=41462 RepID=A0AAW1Q594_9CHLO